MTKEMILIAKDKYSQLMRERNPVAEKHDAMDQTETNVGDSDSDKTKTSVDTTNYLNQSGKGTDNSFESDLKETTQRIL